MEEQLWHKQGYFWIKVCSWGMKRWNMTINPPGDLLYDTLRKIIEDNDKSDWAHHSFWGCYQLLKNGKRWPDEMEQYITRTQKWRSWPIIRLMYFEEKGDYRTQTSITFDPWVMLYACAIHLEVQDFVMLSKPQWWLYRPTRWSWIRKLKGKRNLYEFWKWIMLAPTKQYVIDLHRFKEQALKQIKK